MGRAILELLSEDTQATIVAAVDRADHPQQGQNLALLVGQPNLAGKLSSSLETALDKANVVIDFSSAHITAQLAQMCASKKTALVVGTTGLDESAESALNELAQVAPVVVSPNMSVGVNVLFYLVEQASQRLGAEFDIEMIEMHHKNKMDAPSGTAQRLLEVAAAARGLDAKERAIFGRSGMAGKRPANQIGVMALRGGDVVGDHTVIFAGPSERVELTHRAHSREIFAGGAVRAAHWVHQQKPGRYNMAHVLGLM